MITFGQMLGYQAEVAPVNLMDIKHHTGDGKLTRENGNYGNITTTSVMTKRGSRRACCPASLADRQPYRMENNQ